MNKIHVVDKDPNRDEIELETWKSQIQTLGDEKLIHVVEVLERRWALTSEKCNPLDISRLGYRQFFSPEEIGDDGFPRSVELTVIHSKLERENQFLTQILSRIRTLPHPDVSKLELSTKEPTFGDFCAEGHDLTMAQRLGRLKVQVRDAFKNVRLHHLAQERIRDPTKVQPSYAADPAYFDATPMIDEKKIDEMSPFQRALCFCLNDLFQNGVRRYKGQCMVQRTVNGHFTRAWKEIGSIEEYVYKLADKDTFFDFWKDITSRGTGFRDVINHLTNCSDAQFPEIKPCRHMWSFQNGVFMGKVWSSELNGYTCRFFEYDSKEFAVLDPTKTSCKFFDQQFEDFTHVDDWMDIPTPWTQSIMDYQNFDREVSSWLYAMLGRLTFEVNDLDQWQVVPLLKGVARSGKSTILTKIARSWYQPSDIRTLSNNVERQFGLGSIYDALLYLAPEVKSDLRLEQAEFQSMCSGEDLSVSIKHEKAKSIQWKTPGILAGNEVPGCGNGKNGWKDNGGSILRRLVTWNFAKQVRNADPHLDEKLQGEMPILLYKCVRGYLDYVSKYGSVDIWNCLPPYFATVQKQVAMVSSPLSNFLAQPEIKYGEQLCVPVAIFRQKFNDHCKACGLGTHVFTQDFYAGPFSGRDLVVKPTTMNWKGHNYTNTEFIFGIDIVEDTVSISAADM